MLAVEETPLARLVECDLETLMHAHWKECSIDKEEVPFDPDWTLAAEMERSGVLHAFGLFRHEHLVGYSIYEVAHHLHFKSTKYAFNSAIYVMPAHRGFAGGFMVSTCERLLTDMGVRKITYLAPTGSALGGVLRRTGYEASETYHTKLVS